MHQKERQPENPLRQRKYTEISLLRRTAVTVFFENQNWRAKEERLTVASALVEVSGIVPSLILG